MKTFANILLAGAATLAFTVAAAKAEQITVVSWGGAYTKSQTEA